MATLDLSLVTLTLRNLLHANVRRLLGGVPPDMLQVTTMPPEQVEAGTPTLNLHLYAVREDPHFRNAVGLAGAVPPIAGQPMALRLYYILTPHMTVSEQFDAETQQRVMGMALKTFHDHPVISDTLAVAPNPVEGPLTVMEPALAGDGNRIEVSLRPMEPEEAVNFWAAEDQRTARLSAFYEVRTVLMEPEQPASARGTVFDVGIYARVSAAARITGSRAVLPFEMPAQTGFGAREIAVTPARATLRAPATPGRPRVRVSGHNLTSGDARAVRIRAFSWDAAEVIDPALNPDWALALETNEISFVPQAELRVDDGAGGVAVRAIRPGGHEIGLDVTSWRGQGTARLEARSDAGTAVIGLAPHITGFSGPDGNGRLRLNVDPVVDLLAPGTSVTLSVSGEIYAAVPALPAPPADRGLFRLTAASLRFGPLFDAAQPGAHPVRLSVNGVEAQPFWVEV
ncbi:DUF4255 domain-containing protein [Oceanicella sp. SM1341]|uniref:DUF4255 domain-containing protein n=1 Tax=Oceanicella sp. SM1341 TaxID=1548889 RepID=UPI000E470AEF|nr:DUF4255 domain-containing protein [Oceanicella sp. SM1341]